MINYDDELWWIMQRIYDGELALKSSGLGTGLVHMTRY